MLSTILFMVAAVIGLLLVFNLDYLWYYIQNFLYNMSKRKR